MSRVHKKHLISPNVLNPHGAAATFPTLIRARDGDVVRSEGCRTLTVLLAVSSAARRANLRKHGRHQIPRGVGGWRWWWGEGDVWEHNITNHPPSANH